MKVMNNLISYLINCLIKRLFKPLVKSLFLIFPIICLANGKLLATPGVSQIEGSAGGGLVPWAQLAGYATEDEIAGSAFCSQANLRDFQLNSCGGQVNFHNRLELSFAKQTFNVDPLSLTLSQHIVGIKLRLYGDLIYGEWPQLSVGGQHKLLLTPVVAESLGSRSDTGTDVYLAASKLHLGMLSGYNVLWNVTARYTKANELGLLGFGGEHNELSINTEASVAILLNKHLAIGTEYRQKPDNLGLKEDDWQDIFIAWFPNKHINLTLAYLDLGAIAAIPNQTGWYLSISGAL
jgi:hypothetical protein